jgi:hypothetical protein
VSYSSQHPSFQALPKIQALGYLDHGFTNINDQSLETISYNVQHLKRLSVFECKGVSSNGVQQITLLCKHLEELRMCNKCTTETAQKINNRSL